MKSLLKSRNGKSKESYSSHTVYGGRRWQDRGVIKLRSQRKIERDRRRKTADENIGAIPCLRPKCSLLRDTDQRNWQKMINVDFGKRAFEIELHLLKEIDTVRRFEWNRSPSFSCHLLLLHWKKFQHLHGFAVGSRLGIKCLRKVDSSLRGEKRNRWRFTSLS